MISVLRRECWQIDTVTHGGGHAEYKLENTSKNNHEMKRYLESFGRFYRENNKKSVLRKPVTGLYSLYKNAFKKGESEIKETVA
jgi:hypothetical protein